MKRKKSLLVGAVVAVGLLTGCGSQEESREATELSQLRHEVRELREMQAQAMKYEARQAQEINRYRVEVLKSLNNAEKLSEVTSQN